MEFFHDALIYMLVGVFSGFLAGLFGIGGGIIVVPALLSIFQDNRYISNDMRMVFAVGTSLAIMFVASSVAIRAHRKGGDISWHIFQRLWIGIGFGVISGSALANYIPTSVLKTLFGLFLLVAGWKMLVGNTHEGAQQKLPAGGINFIITYAIGLLSGLLGIGGGILLVPYLAYSQVAARKIPAITAACSLLIASIGIVIFMIVGHSIDAVPLSTGRIYWPAVFWVGIPSLIFAPLGVKVTTVLPVKQLRYAFSLLLWITAVDLLEPVLTIYFSG